MKKEIMNHRIIKEILRITMPQVLIPACFIGLPASYLVFGPAGMIVASLVLCLLTFSGVWMTAIDGSWGGHR